MRPLHSDGEKRLKNQAARYVLSTIVLAPCSLLLPIALHEWAGLSPNLSVAVGLIVAFAMGFVRH